MAVCTFFGHRDCPESVKPRLKDTILDLILNHNVTMFYVGTQGQFDAYVRNTLRNLSVEYPQIQYAVVLAYMPKSGEDHTDTMLPEGIENIPPRFALSWRNNWLLHQADYVVTYITHSWGGAAQFSERAIKQGKITLNLAPEQNHNKNSSPRGDKLLTKF